MLFPVRQLIIVISGNEMAREPTLCWEGSQSLAFYEKQVLWSRKTAEAKALVDCLQHVYD